METTITVILWIVGVLSFLSGIILIVNIQEVSVGKGFGRLVASIAGLGAFYGVADLAYVEEWVEFLNVESTWLKMIIAIIFFVLVLIYLFNFISNWSSEWQKIKEDPNIFGVIVAFTISGLCLGFVA